MKKLFISGASLGLLLCVLTTATAFSQSDNSSQTGSGDLSALVMRQQLRADTIENDLKGVRGALEVGLQDIRKQLEDMAESGPSQADYIRMQDSIDILEQRITRTLELASDVEFRVLRLEKRMRTLLSLSDSDLTAQLAQQDVTAAQTPPSVSVGRDADTGETVWTIGQDQLDAHLDADDESGGGKNSAQQGEDASAERLSAEDSVSRPLEQTQAEVQQQTLKYLPDASPEEQYQAALAHALKNELETAENAFVEFRELHPDHARAVDALFWQGRVQFIQGQFEKAATTFSQFNTLYSSDPRIADTTLWIAESVAKFAEPEQACPIYESLTQLLDQPPESFVARLAELSDRAGCNS